VLTVTLNDLDSDAELADLSEWCLTKRISPRLNRPLSVTLTIPGDTALIRDSSFDGRPNLEVGRRTIKVYQDGVLRGNPLVWNVGPSGDENSTSVLVTCSDPMIRLQSRYVRDADGSLANPVFASPISGAQMLLESIQNSISNSGPDGDNDGPLPIDLTGPISSTLDLAVDLMNWPLKIGDLLTTMTDTGALDVLMLPVDSHMGFPAGTIAQLIAADQLGDDLTGSVNFDYATGDYSVANIRRSFDMDELCNKLQYFLGPKVSDTRYKGNITGTETGAAPGSEDLTAYEALQLASRDLYGTYMELKVLDDNDFESSARKMFHQLWKNEVKLRVNPRELLFITPAAGTGSPFRPFIDYNLGDLITTDAADIVGPAITGAFQRLYGFDLNEDQDGVERVSEFIVSADGE
jgi:hypothetical protein